jgi:predicted lipoprotein with Yx(FWY)xxD motif
MIRSALAAGLLIIGTAASASGPTTVKNGVLADAAGMSLYTFSKDTPNTSACYDACAKAWPPFLVTKDEKPAGALQIAARKDGARQWTHKGRPLYFFAGDAKPGDVNGDGSGGVWSLVREGGAAPQKTSASTY